MKRELLVPGSRLPTPAQSRVPILLVNQAGKQLGEERLGWGSGWDLLLPKGWGMAFWIPLVYCGVRVGGLQMNLKHSQNKSTPHFPHDYPDCPAGVRFQEQQESELLEKFKRYPPAKRTNYIKYGCLSPFRCPWQQLVEEWEERAKQHEDEQDNKTEMKDMTSLSEKRPNPASAFTVLRSRKVLRQISVWCQPSSLHARRERRRSCAPPLCPAASISLQTRWKRCVLWVRVCTLGKGQPARHAMICVPTTEDLQCFREDPQWSGPKEPMHIDHLKQQMKKKTKRGEAALCRPALKKEQDCNIPDKDDPSIASKMDKKTDRVLINQHLRPCAVLSDPLSEPTASVSTDSLQPGVQSLPVKSNLVQGLWTEPLPNLSAHCSRMTLGWVVQGDFSLATGTGEGLGFVSLVGLLQTLLRQSVDQQGIVLLRNPTSLQYRFARLCIEA